jgi:hypothetical protein
MEVADATTKLQIKISKVENGDLIYALPH